MANIFWENNELTELEIIPKMGCTKECYKGWNNLQSEVKDHAHDWTKITLKYNNVRHWWWKAWGEVITKDQSTKVIWDGCLQVSIAIFGIWLFCECTKIKVGQWIMNGDIVRLKFYKSINQWYV